VFYVVELGVLAAGALVAWRERPVRRPSAGRDTGALAPPEPHTP
jgi:hypothetical protein